MAIELRRTLAFVREAQSERFWRTYRFGNSMPAMSQKVSSLWSILNETAANSLFVS